MQAYSGGQKIAQATFEAVPEPEPRSIRGVVTYSGGEPPQEFALVLKQGEERFRVEVEPDGTFDIEVPSGAFVVEVRAISTIIGVSQGGMTVQA